MKHICTGKFSFENKFATWLVKRMRRSRLILAPPSEYQSLRTCSNYHHHHHHDYAIQRTMDPATSVARTWLKVDENICGTTF